MLTLEIENKKVENIFGNSVDEIKQFLIYLTEHKLQVIEDYFQNSSNNELLERLNDIKNQKVNLLNREDIFDV